MNRDALIQEVAERTDEPLGIVEQILAETFLVIRERLIQGESVNIDSFGNFFVRPAAATNRDNGFGQPVEHPPYKQVCFRANHVVRRHANGGRGAPEPQQ